MSKKVGELFVELVVDAASGNLSVRQMVGALGELDVASAASVGILGKVGETLYDMAKAATDTAVELTALHDLTGADPKIVQQWDKAAAGIVGSAGVIVKAITSVNEIQKRLASGQGAPAALTGLLGLTAYKVDANGKETLKDAMELMRDMAKPGSLYRSRSRLVQEAGLQELFGGNADNVYRIIQSMIAGKFHPENEPGMNNRQVRDLNQVRMKEIEVGQKLTGIFQDLLLGGGQFAKVLDSLSQKLEVIDKWLQSKEGQQLFTSTGTVVSQFFKSWGDPRAFGRNMFNILEKPVETHAIAPSLNLRVDDLKGVLDINLKHNGVPIATKRTFLDRKTTNRDVFDATLTQGLTP